MYTYDAADNQVVIPMGNIQAQRSTVSATSSAFVEKRNVRIKWQVSEPDKVQGIAIYRSYGSQPDDAVRLTPKDIVAANMDELGVVNFSDPEVAPDGAHTYWLVQVTDGEDTDLLGQVEVVIDSNIEFTESVLLPVVNR